MCGRVVVVALHTHVQTMEFAYTNHPTDIKVWYIIPEKNVSRDYYAHLGDKYALLAVHLSVSIIYRHFVFSLLTTNQPTDIKVW